MITLNNVKVQLGNQTILHDVSLEVNSGEILSLIGLNGAGKTTLLKTMMGIIKPTSGTVDNSFRQIGYVPQRLDFDRSIPLTVEEFLLSYNKTTPQKITNTLNEVGLTKTAHTLQLGALSGGQLQRVLIANALLSNPDILMLDEATAGIDVQGEKQFYQLISQLHQKYKMTVILVSHDLHTVFANTDRVICLNGCICCQGTPENVANHNAFKELFGAHVIPYQHQHSKHHHLAHNHTDHDSDSCQHA